MTISRREFLQAAAAAGLVMSVSIAPVEAIELPINTSTLSPDGGVNFNGALGGVYVMPKRPQRDRFAEVWITRPGGTVLMHGQFAQRGGWYWLADLGIHIIGQVNVACSVDADIILAAIP